MSIEIPKSQVQVHAPTAMVGTEKLFYTIGKVFVKQDVGDYSVYPSLPDGTRTSGPPESWPTDPRDAAQAVSVGKVIMILGIMTTIVVTIWLALRRREH
jgi:hypothetical protein